MAMTPDEQGIFYVLVVSGGPGAGEFTYDASGNLRSSNVGQATTDPIQGISCPQGFATYNGHGAVLNLLSTTATAAGFFQYFDNASPVQGARILVIAATGGTDPVTGTAYAAGMTGIDPVFGDAIQTVGANISLIQVGYTRNANIAAALGGGATQPKLQLDAPEQTTASHLQIWMTGASPDATKVAQFILAAVAGGGAITPQTSALLEVQGDIAAKAMSEITASSVNNSIAETTIASFTIPANDPGAANTLYEYAAHGSVQCSVAATVTFRVRITGPAGNLLLSTPVLTCTVAAGVNKDWSVDGRLAFRGSGAATNVDSWGRIMETITAAGSAATDHPDLRPFVAVNTTAAVVIAVTAQFSVMNAGNSAAGIDGSMIRFSR